MNRINIGPRAIDQRQLEALRRHAPSKNDVLDNLDLLNEEIEESVPADLILQGEPVAEPEVAQPVRPVVRQVAPVKTQTIEARKQEGANMDFLDKEAAEAERKLAVKRRAEAAAAAEEQPQPQEPKLSPEEQRKAMLMDMLSRIPGAPTEQKIEALKAQHGKNNVHVLALGDDDIYFFTQLTRGTWKKIQSTVSKTAAADPNKDAEDYMRELVLRSCTLWPTLSVEFFYTSKAGVIDTLYEMIMLHSGFLSPQQAMMLTTQL